VRKTKTLRDRGDVQRTIDDPGDDDENPKPPEDELRANGPPEEMLEGWLHEDGDLSDLGRELCEEGDGRGE
jgi:hypothetical protein